MAVETPHPTEEGFKRGDEDVINIDAKTSQTSKKPKMHTEEKKIEPLVERPSTGTNL